MEAAAAPAQAWRRLNRLARGACKGLGILMQQRLERTHAMRSDAASCRRSGRLRILLDARGRRACLCCAGSALCGGRKLAGAVRALAGCAAIAAAPVLGNPGAADATCSRSWRGVAAVFQRLAAERGRVGARVERTPCAAVACADQRAMQRVDVAADIFGARPHERDNQVDLAARAC
jgi:hypothetical protein